MREGKIMKTNIDTNTQYLGMFSNPIDFRNLKTRSEHTALVWSISGLILAACGGGGGGPVVSGVPAMLQPLAFHPDLDDVSIDETENPEDFRLPLTTGGRGKVLYMLTNGENVFGIDNQGNLVFANPNNVYLDQDGFALGGTISQYEVNVEAIDEGTSIDDPNRTISISFTIKINAIDEAPIVPEHVIRRMESGEVQGDVGSEIFGGERAIDRPIDPDAANIMEFYWRIADLPSGGEFAIQAVSNTPFQSAELGQVFDENELSDTSLFSNTTFRYTHDGINRILGADDVYVVVFDVADQNFNSNPDAPSEEQYFIYIIQEGNYTVNSPGDDTGIRFIVNTDFIITIDQLEIRAVSGVTSNNFNLFEIKEITNSLERQNIPDELPIYGVYAKTDANLSNAVDDDTSDIDIDVLIEIVPSFADVIDLPSIVVDLS